MSTEKKLSIVEIIEIVYGVACAELDALDLSGVDVINILLLRGNSAKLESLPCFLNGILQLTVEDGRSRGVIYLIVALLSTVVNDLAAVHKEHKSVGINVYNRTIGNIVVGSLLVGTFLNSNALYKQGAVAHIIGFDNFLPGIGKYA